MFIHNLNPELFSIGPLQVRYYGIFYVGAFILAYFIIPYLAKQRNLELTKDDVSDYLLYLLVGIVLGSRLVHVLANLSFYLANPFQIIAIWQGGLWFHGGLIGAIVAAYLFAKKKKIHLYDLADITVAPVALGLALGRIGNFINAELVGRITDVSWAVNFNNENLDGNPVFRHPVQIYKSLKDFVLFFVLFFISSKNWPRGFLFWTFITLYSLFRISVDFFIDPGQYGFYFGFLTIGQVLTIPMFIVGVIMLFKIWKK